MKTLRFRHPRTPNRDRDISRIIETFLKKGYKLPTTDAALAWEYFSEEGHDSGWVSLPESEDEIFDIVFPLLKEVDV